jgi:hypothetical protein
MTITDLNINQIDTNARAEDGLKRNAWNTLCEDIFIPLGTLVAVFLGIAGVMLVSR